VKVQLIREKRLAIRRDIEEPENGVTAHILRPPPTRFPKKQPPKFWLSWPRAPLVLTTLLGLLQSKRTTRAGSPRHRQRNTPAFWLTGRDSLSKKGQTNSTPAAPAVPATVLATAGVARASWRVFIRFGQHAHFIHIQKGFCKIAG
jgi:hypothetical protein